MKKRILSLLLAILMVIALLPTAAFAAANFDIFWDIDGEGTVAEKPRSAAAGATVTIKPVPNDGYGVKTVDVKDRYHSTVAVNGPDANGWYTFVMPSQYVDVKVDFAAHAKGIGFWRTNKTNLKKGETTTLNIEFTPFTVCDETVTWDSDNPAVATVDNTGKVTAVAPGTANITVTARDGGHQATCTITVKETYAITKTPTTNGTFTVKVSGREVTSAEENNRVTITPTPAPGYEVETITVTKADDSNVSVNANNQFTMPGEAVTVSVTFREVPVTGVSLNATEIDLTVGNTETLIATVTPDNANRNVTWSSSDDTVATVDNGVVTAVAPGTATITATTADGRFEDTCDVTVGYHLWVGDVQVSPANADDVLDDGTVSFNPTTNTLTLDNFHCTIEDTDEYYAGVKTAIEGLTILLRGNNSITVENYGNGIVADGNVTIRDDDTDNSVGSLQITSYYEGLYCCSDLNVENVRLDVASEGDVGIVCDGAFNVVNSVIDAAGYDGAFSCDTLPNLIGEYKVYTGFFKPELVEVENPGESDYEEWCVRIAPSSLVYYPVWIGETQFASDCLTIAGDSGTATLTVGNDNGTPTYTLTLANFSCSGEGILYAGLEAVRGYCALYTNEDLTILLRGNNSLSCAGSYEHGYYSGIVVYGDLTICDDPNHSGTGKLAVNSGNCGIDAWNIDVLNCRLDMTVDGGDREWMDAIGIYTEDEINIQGSEVTVSAATGENGYSYGICEADGVTVEDGTLIVTAADQAFYSDYEITVHAENAIVYVGVDEASAEAAGPVSDDDKREFDTYTNKYVRIEHTAPVYFDPAYPVVENKGEDPDGTVKFSSNYSTPGSTVTVTVTPDKYYGVEKVIVRDASGKEIPTTKNADGTYSFKMPSGKVTVEAVYVWENPFVDVAEGTFYIDAVEWALKNGITEGTSETTFSPIASCTRAQMVTFLWRAAGSPEPKTAECQFTDVDMDSYYGKAVLWALEKGITNGTSETAFSPDMECSRAQMATFLCRMAGGKAESDTIAFTDVKADAYYAESVQWAVENGITNGTGDNKFSPDTTCTRGQIVTFLYRYFVK